MKSKEQLKADVVMLQRCLKRCSGRSYELLKETLASDRTLMTAYVHYLLRLNFPNETKKIKRIHKQLSKVCKMKSDNDRTK